MAQPQGERSGAVSETRELAILFVDMCQGTRFFEERGDTEARGISGQLIALLEEIAIECEGTPVKSLGDGLLVHFDGATRSGPRCAPAHRPAASA